MQRLFGFLIEKGTKLVLVSGFFINPETNLISKPLVVVTSREQGMLHSSYIDILSPTSAFEVLIQAGIHVIVFVFRSVWNFLPLFFLWR